MPAAPAPSLTPPDRRRNANANAGPARASRDSSHAHGFGGKMRDILNLLFVIACVAAPFVAMPLLWRRMKRVRAGSYVAREQLPPAVPWRDTVRDADGLSRDRPHDPNDELIALGDKAAHARWPLDNQ